MWCRLLLHLALKKVFTLIVMNTPLHFRRHNNININHILFSTDMHSLILPNLQSERYTSREITSNQSPPGLRRSGNMTLRWFGWVQRRTTGRIESHQHIRLGQNNSWNTKGMKDLLNKGDFQIVQSVTKTTHINKSKWERKKQVNGQCSSQGREKHEMFHHFLTCYALMMLQHQHKSVKYLFKSQIWASQNTFTNSFMTVSSDK